MAPDWFISSRRKTVLSHKRTSPQRARLPQQFKVSRTQNCFLISQAASNRWPTVREFDLGHDFGTWREPNSFNVLRLRSRGPWSCGGTVTGSPCSVGWNTETNGSSINVNQNQLPDTAPSWTDDGGRHFPAMRMPGALWVQIVWRTPTLDVMKFLL